MRWLARCSASFGLPTTSSRVRGAWCSSARLPGSPPRSFAAVRGSSTSGPVHPRGSQPRSLHALAWPPTMIGITFTRASSYTPFLPHVVRPQARPQVQ